MMVLRQKDPTLGGKFVYQPPSVGVYCPGCGGIDKNTVVPTFQAVEYPEKVLCSMCHHRLQTREKIEVKEVGNW